MDTELTLFPFFPRVTLPPFSTFAPFLRHFFFFFFFFSSPHHSEMRNNSKCVIRMDGNTTTLVQPASLDLPFAKQEKKTFAYDYSYWSFSEESTGSKDFAAQDTVFEDLGRKIVGNSFQGYNCSLMAYGQTGSGKTYSMMGGKEAEQRGLIPRICAALFDRSVTNDDPNLSFKVEVSYLEIYAERIRDLLNPIKQRGPKRGIHGLRVREHPETGPYVEDLTQCAVTNFEELETLMMVGNKERTVAATNMNSESSRSHAVFTVVFTQTRYDDVTDMSTDRVSKVRLVDLAGSERVDHSGVTGVQLKEAANINKSLTTLGRVISALAKASSKTQDKFANSKGSMQNDVFVPFRDSVLTWLLKDSLGGNSKTIMIATVSPADINYDETMSTLRYAASAKKIVNKASVNEDPNAKIIRALRAEVEELRKRLESTGGADTAEKIIELKDQLAQSQKLIADINRSWEEKLEETKRMQMERLNELQNQGVAVRIDHTVPFLVNLNEDPSMTESVIYYLKPGHVFVGKAIQSDGLSIVLRGLNMKDNHCVFINEDTGVTLRPFDIDEPALLFVNGERVTTPRKLLHGDRVIIGQNHIFRFSNPMNKDKTVGGRSTTSDDSIISGKSVRQSLPPFVARRGRSTTVGHIELHPQASVPEATAQSSVYDWDFANRELMVAQGRINEFVDDSSQEKESYRLLEEKLQILEQEGSKTQTMLKEQQRKYIDLLTKYKEAQALEEAAEFDDEESKIIESQARAKKQKLVEELMKILPLVDEANAICEALGKHVRFEVELVTFYDTHGEQQNLEMTGISPVQRLRRLKETKITLKVQRGHGKTERSRSRHSIWEKDEFVEKLFLLRDMYNRVSDYGEDELRNCEDPLESETLETQLIGTGHIYLESLFFGIGIQQRTQILDHRGDYAGLLTVQIHCTSSHIDSDSEFSDNLDSPTTPRRPKKMSPMSPQMSPTDDRGNRLARSDSMSSLASLSSTMSSALENEDVSDLRIRPERIAGRFNLKQEITSQEPISGKPLPIGVRIARADRIPGIGIKDVMVKYKFYNDPTVYSTQPIQVTSEHQASNLATPQIRRRKKPARLSQPLMFDYDMRHDVSKVDRKFINYLKTDAIRFEIWGSFDTSLERKTTTEKFSPSKSPSAADTARRRSSFLQRQAGGMGGVLPSNSNADLSVLPRGVSLQQSPSTQSDLQLGHEMKNDQDNDETILRRKKAAGVVDPSEFRDVLAKEHEQRQDRKGNLLFVAVDVEELDQRGRFNPCILKDSPGNDPPVTFRVTAGSERPKRFVFTVIQVDSYDFILESCAHTQVANLAVEEKIEPIDLGLPLNDDNVSVMSASTLRLKAPIKLNVWEQAYHIQDKLIQIRVNWVPELTSRSLMRRMTPQGDRVTIEFDVHLYLSRTTTPICVSPKIAVKVYDAHKTVSRMRSFFKGIHNGSNRLHQLGGYYRVIREGSEMGLENILNQHHKALSKLEHNMRIEQIQQHLILLKTLQARNSSRVFEAKQGFESTLDAISKEAALPSEFLQGEVALKNVNQSRITVRRVPDSAAIVKRGFLYKCGKYHTKWKKRWFLLRPPHLYYFKKASDEKPKGVIDLIGATVRLADAKKREKAPFSFEIHSQTRVWFLQANSEGDMQKWIEGILEFNDFQ